MDIDEQEYQECIPPSVVYCLSRGAGEAAVWWLIAATDEERAAYPDMRSNIDIAPLSALNGITAWSVMRYRRDRSPPFEWRLKGSTQTNSERITHALISGLSKGYEYRFTVKAVSGAQMGAESEPSNAVIPEEALPSGWFRVPVPDDMRDQLQHDNQAEGMRRLYYYANIKTKQTSWERPETDPYFLQDAVYCRFNKREHTFLRGLYDEEIANCGVVSINGCRDMLLEAGERITRKQLAVLIKEYSGSFGSISDYSHFINICVYAKDHNHRLSLSVMQALWSYTKRKLKGLVRMICGAGAVTAVPTLSSEKDRLGKWVLEHNELVDRYFYRNPETKTMQWEMPDEVRFYVEPTLLFPKVIGLLGFDNYQTLVMMYSEVNRDCSGFISEHELRLIIAKIGIYVPRLELNGYFLDRDVAGKGQLAFNEFIDVVVYLLTRNENAALSTVLDTFKELFWERDGSLSGDNASVGYFDLDQDHLLSRDCSFDGRKVRFNDERRRSILSRVSEGNDGEISGDANDMSTNDGSVHQNYSSTIRNHCVGGVRGCFGRLKGKNRYQVDPGRGSSEEDGDDDSTVVSGREHTKPGSSRANGLSRGKSAQELMEEEDAKLMDAARPTRHLSDCMCGCRKIVELFDTND